MLPWASRQAIHGGHPASRPAAAPPGPIIYRHGKRNVRLHFGAMLPIVCPTADDSQSSGLAVFAGSLEEANAIMDARPAVQAACSPRTPIAPAEEAVQLRRAQAGDDPAYLPGYAAALTDLGVCYRGASRRQDAIAPVGFRNSATYAARLYSLMRPPGRGSRWIRLRERSARGWSGRGGRRWRCDEVAARCNGPHTGPGSSADAARRR